MDVSVIIVNYNTKDLVRNCIESIRKVSAGFTYEIIVVDNASGDGSKQYFQKDPSVRYVYNTENIGFGRANNIGVKIASGRNIFFLNPDTLLINNAIKILSDYLDNNSGVGCCGGNLYNGDMMPIHSYSMMLPSIQWELNLLGGGLIEKVKWGKDAQFNNGKNVREVGYICGADMMVRHSVLDEVGLFSDLFFMYYEDTELSYRIKEAGYEIVSVPEAKIQHLVGKSMGGRAFNPKRVLYVEKGLSVFYLLHKNPVERKILKSLRLLRLMFKYCIIYRNQYSSELYKSCVHLICEDKIEKILNIDNYAEGCIASK